METRHTRRTVSKRSSRQCKEQPAATYVQRKIESCGSGKANQSKQRETLRFVAKRDVICTIHSLTAQERVSSHKDEAKKKKEVQAG